MPEDEVRRLHGQGKTEIEMALYFDVSREAMHYRLRNLGLGL
jgi:Zn-dependent peptidase ImmA (M78 family)